MPSPYVLLACCGLAYGLLCLGALVIHVEAVRAFERNGGR